MVGEAYRFKFSDMWKCPRALYYHDIDLVTRFSNVLPHEVSLKTRITRRIEANIPLLSAAMTDVSEAAMGIKLGLLGGIAVIHKTNTPEQQAEIVKAIKRFTQGCIIEPVVLSPDSPLDAAYSILKKYKYSTIPITADGQAHGKLVGLLKENPIYLKRHVGERMTVKDRMRPPSDILIRPHGIGTEEATNILLETGREELLITDKENNLWGMYKLANIAMADAYPNICKDGKGRIRVAAAIGGPGSDLMDRMRRLSEAEVDIIVIDTSQGWSKGVGELTLPVVKREYPEIDVIAGNVDNGAGARFLIERGADAVKVGIGPSPICRTKNNTGGGMPQLTAVHEVAEVAEKYGIPVIADGGIIEVAADLFKAFAAGASSVMLGSLLAGTDEAPGREIWLEGKKYKEYKGMGSIEAQKAGSASRYFQEGVPENRLVSHGVVAAIPSKGPAEVQINHITDTLKDAMSKYYGCRTVEDIRKADLEFVLVNRSPPAQPHGIVILKGE